jgi:hypothetical protein
MGWIDGDNAYAIAIDNIDGNDGDLDFFDIGDPANPVWLSETGIDDWPTAEVNAFGDFPTSHDFDVREIGGTWYAMVSYWDAGWVLLNVDDPANPVFIEDSEYKPCDDYVVTACPPEGERPPRRVGPRRQHLHRDGEDFSAYRLTFDVTTGPHAGPYEAGEFSWTTPIVNEPDQSMNGPTIFGAYGCPQSTDDVPTAAEAMEMYDITLEENEDLILVTQRGPVQDRNAPYEACFFSEKVEFAQDLGYDGAIVANHHVGAGGEPGGGGHFAHAFICGSQVVFTPTIPERAPDMRPCTTSSTRVRSLRPTLRTSPCPTRWVTPVTSSRRGRSGCRGVGYGRVRWLGARASARRRRTGPPGGGLLHHPGDSRRGLRAGLR